MRKVEVTGLDTSTIPKLTQNQSKELLFRIANGDEQAKDEFLLANLRLVLSIVQRFGRNFDSVDDLFQVGCIGLMKSLNNFDHTLGVQFSTYAVPMIIGEIKRYMRDRNGIKVSRSLRDTAYQALKTREKILNENSIAEPTLFEIAEELAIPTSEIACALDAVSEPISLFDSAFTDGEENMLVLDQIADEKCNWDKISEHLSLRSALTTLNEKESQIINMRYYQGKTQTEISKLVNMSQAQISRLEKTALEKLKKQLD